MQLHHAVSVIEVRIGDILGRRLLQKPAQRLPAVFGFKLQEPVLGNEGADVRVVGVEALAQSLLIFPVPLSPHAHEDVEEEPVWS